MYKLKPGIKADPKRRWALPGRIFFGHGACAILAGVCLRHPQFVGFYAERIIPGDGFAGNHIYVTDGTVAFDYHGYTSRLGLLLHHTTGWAKSYAEGWHCSLESVGFDLLSTTELNKRKMFGAEQYAGDVVDRARAFIDLINHDETVARARRASGGAGTAKQ